VGLDKGEFPYSRSGADASVWQGTVLVDKADATGTYYRRNRSYDPNTARFTQEDPIGLAGGMNLYGFAAGDPANYSDPFGLCGEKDDDPCPNPDFAEAFRQIAQKSDAIEDFIVGTTAVTMAPVVAIAAAEAAPAVAAGSAEAATNVAVNYSNRASVQFTVGFARGLYASAEPSNGLKPGLFLAEKVGFRAGQATALVVKHADKIPIVLSWIRNHVGQ
jgi:RHS repeat-associated protein